MFGQPRYFNQMLPLCDFLLLGYSTMWTQSTVKYSLILQHMTLLEEYALTDVDFIKLMKSKKNRIEIDQNNDIIIYYII